MRALRTAGLALLCYTALVLVLFHGLFGQFSSAVPHDLGDPLLSTSILWWNAHHLPFTAQWWDGPSFFPEHGSLAFSDHRVGLGLIAGPIQWLGGTPVLAYNVTLLSSFVFAALAAHALTWTLTRNHPAGAVSGLIFGFNPFRISHIAHLELLVVCWLPLAFLALHRYVRRFDTRWLCLFAVLWGLQGLSSGYYLFYSAPVIGIWTLWFARERLWRSVAAVALACAAVFVVLSPILLHYRTVQSHLLLTRSLGEIEFYSADITGLLSATPIMALWRVPSLAANGEAEIYLGIVAPLLVLAGCFWRSRATGTPRAPAPRGHAWRLALASISAVYALLAVGTLFGAWSVRLGPVAVSVSQTNRPLAAAVLALLLLGLTSAPFLAIVERGSAFAFYTLAAAMTWVFTWGPEPTLLGNQLLYRGPYALLMLLPGFDERLRAPARFVMLTILAVAVAAGLAFVRLTASTSKTVRRSLTILVVAAIVADSWTFACPIRAVPQIIQLPATVPASAAVLELPLGEVGRDIAADYRAIGHGHSVVNGYSGYDPPHYRVLRHALEARDDSALTTLTTFAPLAVIISRDDPGGGWETLVAQHAGAVLLERTDGYTLYLLPAAPRVDTSFDGPVPIRAASAHGETFDIKTVTDGDLTTAWATPTPQKQPEDIVVQLQDTSRVSGLSLATGAFVENFPERLAVTTSLDGHTWDDAWTGGLGGAALAAVLADPAVGRSRIRFAPRMARFVRLRQLDLRQTDGWTIAEMTVDGAVKDGAPGRN